MPKQGHRFFFGRFESLAIFFFNLVWEAFIACLFLPLVTTLLRHEVDFVELWILFNFSLIPSVYLQWPLKIGRKFLYMSSLWALAVLKLFLLAKSALADTNQSSVVLLLNTEWICVPAPPWFVLIWIFKQPAGQLDGFLFQ